MSGVWRSQQETPIEGRSNTVCSVDVPCLPRWSEELKSDAVWIAERQPRAIGRVDDPTVLDAQVVQSTLPLHELGPVATRERQMVQARTTLVERLGALEIGERVDPDECPAHEPDDMVEGTCVFVDHRIGAEQPLIPGAAALEVAHCKGDVRDCREVGQRVLPF